MWDKLAELARREREIVAAGHWDELIELQAERQRLIDRLPPQPPAEAEGVLEEALEQSRATQTALTAALAELESALGAVRRGRRAVSAYGLGADSALDRRA
jgi:hypothetical protein